MIRPILIVCGLGLFVGAGVAAESARGFVQGSSAADGLVTAGSGSRPHVEFSTSLGQPVSYTQRGLALGFRPGEKVRVLYNADDPAGSARISSFSTLWLKPSLLLLLGIVATMVGLSSRSKT